MSFYIVTVRVFVQRKQVHVHVKRLHYNASLDCKGSNLGNREYTLCVEMMVRTYTYL